jgi:hypothetical protein
MAVPRLRHEAWGDLALELATAKQQFLRVLLLGKQAVANDGQPNVNKFLRDRSLLLFRLTMFLG